MTSRDNDNNGQRGSFFLKEKPEHAWMKPVAGAHMGTVKVTSRIVFYVITLFFIIFLVWSSFFEIDEYVRAQGQIQPEGVIKTISHFEGGVLQNIFVKEGDVVFPGQVLIQLKDISTKATYQESLHNYYLHWAEILRLKAQIDETPLELPNKIQKNSTRIYREVEARYRARMAAYNNDKKILEDQLSGFNSELAELNKKIEGLETLHRISKERTELLTKLVDQNLLLLRQ
jgi:multidrug efflux pump subunit AcrA (membrane-fusion protein)